MARDTEWNNKECEVAGWLLITPINRIFYAWKKLVKGQNYKMVDVLHRSPERWSDWTLGTGETWARGHVHPRLFLSLEYATKNYGWFFIEWIVCWWPEAALTIDELLFECKMDFVSHFWAHKKGRLGRS